jgi:hypothetical protein
LFTVVAGTFCGTPAASAAWRPGAWPMPAMSTQPKMVSSICAASMPLSLIAA